MVSFYLDKDLRSNRVFIAPAGKAVDGPYLIECSKAYQAHDLLKKLNAGILLGPRERPEIWQQIDSIINSLGEVEVFILKKAGN